MIYTYRECIKKYKTEYNINKKVKEGLLFKLERGIYSDKKVESEMLIISKLYPYAVFTLNSAFYYYGLTDTIPSYYYLITNKNCTKISDPRVKQFFDNNDIKLGLVSVEYNGSTIQIFNKERLLVELIRYKHKFPFDYYKEIINNYRKIINTLDIQLIQEYAQELPKANLVMKTLQMEVL